MYDVAFVRVCFGIVATVITLQKQYYSILNGARLQDFENCLIDHFLSRNL